jgi:hypothetical protein
MGPSWAPQDAMGSPSAAGGSGHTAGPAPSGPAAPAGPAAPTPGRRGGTAINFRRGRHSAERLKIEWAYPVWKPGDGSASAAPGTTVAAVTEHALPYEQALSLVVGDDKRPLLVLRECELCKGTDHALLSRTLDNEQTVLLTHWFHCVKLPPNVLGTNHPLSQLFAHKDGEQIPHLYFCDPDGGNKTALPGDQSQTELWGVMFSFLERAYQGDAKKAIKDMRGILSQFDKIDSMEDEIKARIDRETEKHGPGSEKIRGYEQDLQALAKERQKLLERERATRELALKTLAAKDAAPQPAGSVSR